MTERVRDEEIELVHLPDAGMFMDFFTKWLPDQGKVEASLAYLNGAMARAAYLKDLNVSQEAHILSMVDMAEAMASAVGEM